MSEVGFSLKREAILLMCDVMLAEHQHSQSVLHASIPAVYMQMQGSAPQLQQHCTQYARASSWPSMAATVRELAARPEQMVRTETRMQCSAQLIALALVRAEIKSCGPSRSHQRSSSSAAPPSSPSMDDHVHVIWALPMAMPIDLPPYLSTVHVHDDGIRSNRRTERSRH